MPCSSQHLPSQTCADVAVDPTRHVLHTQAGISAHLPPPPARPLRREQRQPSLVTLTPKPRLPSSRNKEHLARTCLPAGRAAPVLHRRLPCSSFRDVFAAPQQYLLMAQWLLGGHRSLGVAPREVGVSGILSRCSGKVSSSERVWWLCWKLSRV